MNIKAGRLIFLLLFFPVVAFSQIGNWEIFNESTTGDWIDPVRSSDAFDIDSKGVVWLGTYNGIFTYEGEKWTLVETKGDNHFNPHINVVEIDQDDTKWFGTLWGLIEYKDGAVVNKYDKSNSKLLTNTITCITIDANGKKWIGTSKGLCTWDGSQWQEFEFNTELKDAYVQSIAEETNGDMWIGTKSGLVQIDPAGDWQLYTSSNSELSDNDIRYVYIDDNQTKWIATFNRGLTRLTESGRWKVMHTRNSGLPENHVLCVDKDNDGNIYVGTLSKGMAVYDGKNWAKYNMKNSTLKTNTISFIKIDEDNNKWIGMFDQGVALSKAAAIVDGKKSGGEE